jgi:hypothetical protein
MSTSSSQTSTPEKRALATAGRRITPSAPNLDVAPSYNKWGRIADLAGAAREPMAQIRMRVG